MPEHIRALIVIVFLSLCFFFVQRKLLPDWYSEREFLVRRNAWFGITTVAFLSGGFWYYVIGTFAVLLIASTREKNRIALYLALLFAIPPFEMPIPGFGLIQQVFPINYPRLLALLLLLPLFCSIVAERHRMNFGAIALDKAATAYFAVHVGFQIAFNSFTQIQRGILLLFIETLLPYYVISRGIRSLADFKVVIFAFGFAIFALAPISLFEWSRHWLLYSKLDDVLGVAFGFGNYLSRGESIRATASASHPIALGYTVAVGMCLYSYIARFIIYRWLRWVGWFILILALVSTVSRGPWVGAAVGLLFLLITSSPTREQVMTAAGVLATAAFGLALSPLGPVIVDYLPFIGTVDEGSVTYRQQVFSVTLDVILQYPLFGAYGYTGSALEQLRQGEGIIDIVNTYIGVALSSGLVGLVAFVAILLFSISTLWKCWDRARATESEDLAAIARALIASALTTAVTLATTSMVGLIFHLYWVLGALSAAFFIQTQSIVLQKASTAKRHY